MSLKIEDVRPGDVVRITFTSMPDSFYAIIYQDDHKKKNLMFINANYEDSEPAGKWKSSKIELFLDKMTRITHIDAGNFIKELKKIDN